MTDETFRPDSARTAAERAESGDPAREWLDEAVAQPEAWPEPRSTVRDQPEASQRRRGGAGAALGGAANLAFTAYYVSEIAGSDDDYDDGTWAQGATGDSGSGGYAG